MFAGRCPQHQARLSQAASGPAGAQQQPRQAGGEPDEASGSHHRRDDDQRPPGRRTGRADPGLPAAHAVIAESLKTT